MLIRILCSVLMICCLPGCYVFDADLPRPKGEYGQRSEKNITITATTGFRKPGIHHVPQGTTLREFFRIAKILPSREWGQYEFMCGCRVRQMHEGKATGFFSRAKPSEKQLDTPLENEAEVAVLKWNW